MSTPTMYTPPVIQFSNEELNALGSEYAARYGHSVGNVVARMTRDLIYDSTPKQFTDLKLLNAKSPRTERSDEFNYQETGYGRSPLIVTAIAATVSWPTAQTVYVEGTDPVSVDTIVIYPSNKKGTVTAINTDLGTVEITPMSGDTLPATAVGDKLANHSPVERDSADQISQYFRQGIIERTNYIQMLVKGMRFGKMELYKLKNGAISSNYLTMQKEKFMQQFRTDLSNILWNGEKGEVKLADGTVAKTADGISPIMSKTGSPNVSTGASTADTALEELALLTNYGSEGETKFLYGPPRHILNISKLYKHERTRYEPNDMMAKLNLLQVDMGFTKVVFVPMKRFEDQASFPTSWQNKLFLLDQESMTPVIAWGEQIGETADRDDNVNLNTFKDYWISGTFSLEFNNPLGSGWMDIV